MVVVSGFNLISPSTIEFDFDSISSSVDSLRNELIKFLFLLFNFILNSCACWLTSRDSAADWEWLSETKVVEWGVLSCISMKQLSVVLIIFFSFFILLSYRSSILSNSSFDKSSWLHDQQLQIYWFIAFCSSSRTKQSRVEVLFPPSPVWWFFSVSLSRVSEMPVL